MRQRSQLKGSPADEAGGGSALITETLLPRLTGGARAFVCTGVSCSVAMRCDAMLMKSDTAW